MLSAGSSKASLLEAKSLLSTSHLGRMSSRPNVGRRYVETVVISSRQKSRAGLSLAAVADVITVADIIIAVITLAVAQQQPVLKPIIKTQSGRSIKPPIHFADYVAS